MAEGGSFGFGGVAELSLGLAHIYQTRVMAT